MILNSVAIGVDIGGTHISAAPLNTHDYSINFALYKRVAYDSNIDVQSVLAIWSEVLGEIIKQANINKSAIQIGISMPGPMDYENGISYIQNQNKYSQFYNVNIKKLLADKLNVALKSIHFINDAAAFLQGEIALSPYLTKRNPVGITLGTGLGSARIADGIVVDASLWNHPFKSGIAEDFISSRWIVDSFKRKTGKSLRNVKELIDIIELDGKNSSVGLEILTEFGQNIVDFVEQMVSVINPATIVLGGNISKSYKYFSESFTNIKNIEIVKSQLGENAAIVGAVHAMQQINYLKV